MPKLNKSRAALRWMTVFLALEAIGWLAIVSWLGSFIYGHWGTWTMVTLGVGCDLYAISLLAGTIRLMAAATQVDYNGPVAAIQNQLGNLRVMRIRLTQWGVLAGVMLWAPFAVVLLNGFSSGAWLAANVAFGIALALLTYWLSKRFSDRIEKSPFIQRMMRDIGGLSLAAAERHLGELTKWQTS
jgi:hypothetical protein